MWLWIIQQLTIFDWGIKVLWNYFTNGIKKLNVSCICKKADCNSVTMCSDLNAIIKVSFAQDTFCNQFTIFHSELMWLNPIAAWLSNKPVVNVSAAAPPCCIRTGQCSFLRLAGRLKLLLSAIVAVNCIVISSNHLIFNTAPNKNGQTVSRNPLLANVATHSAADKLSMQQQCIKMAFKHLRWWTLAGYLGETFQRRQLLRTHFVKCSLLCLVALPRNVSRTHRKASLKRNS